MTIESTTLLYDEGIGRLVDFRGEKKRNRGMDVRGAAGSVRRNIYGGIVAYFGTK